MESNRQSVQANHHRKSLARACSFCRTRKIRCDAARPRCATCVAQKKECIYRTPAPAQRPTLAQIHDLKKQRFALESMIIRLKSTSEQECTALLAAAHVVDGRVRLPEGLTQTDTTAPRSAHSHDDENINDHCRTGSGSTARSGNASHHTHVEGATNGVDHGNSNPNETSIRSYELRSAAAVRHHFDTAPSLPVGDASSDDEFDVCPFISLDDAGTLRSFGPSSALHRPTRSSSSPQQNNVCITRDQATYSLIAKAAFQRQNERQAALLPDIHGMPTELAMHLLDLHWSRQHHTFLLTYRPAIMRDLLCNGPQCSRFLLYAIFACSSKYSLRLDVRDDPADPSTSGQRYFRHCDDLISRDCLLISPTIPTLVGLLLLGSTYNARGETSKGWLYTGYALRMLTDLGLHLDPRGTTTSPEEKEVRRRIFWGAFVCDKLQSLYLGRPVGINLKDCHVSRDFMDTYEEQELYIPYMDPRHLGLNAGNIASPQPIHSVSTFEQLCLLSKIMAKIINTFYVVGATFKNAQGNLQLIDDVLQKWRENLPPQLRFDPKLHETRSICPAPNQLNLHALHHTLVILLHRPFISDGHLRSTANLSFSWARCTTAARSITCIALAWKSAYGLGGAPYLLSYVTYVACTIHVRNVAAEANNGNRRDHVSMLTMSLACLDELCLANPGVKKPLGIIRASMEARNITLTAEDHMHTGDYSPPTVDIEAMLAASSVVNPDQSAFHLDFPEQIMFNSDMPHDPLFGLMNTSVMPSDMYPFFAGNAHDRINGTTGSSMAY